MAGSLSIVPMWGVAESVTINVSMPSYYSQCAFRSVISLCGLNVAELGGQDGRYRIFAASPSTVSFNTDYGNLIPIASLYE
jgi:hypothetical protein